MGYLESDAMDTKCLYPNDAKPGGEKAWQSYRDRFLPWTTMVTTTYLLE